ncbi:hypothetical protein SAMN05421788_11159 [Filimonas lacunae]|uniref:Uncharacterized protein n=1 Tax=Filimonas lacunae TaxID=477680 RepID=A0A1N7RAR0_9BACT|nr:hypothetical protein [Filimonas lacunae]SIT32223.1 hypothetical protein SAMN05421788_11159 [Filimonas lacunae]
MNRSWFTQKDFTSLVITKDKSLADHAVVKSITITDTQYIDRLAARIEQIYPDGDMMISFSGAAEYIRLTFFSGDKIQEIDVIQKGFKTPSTGFNIKNDYEKEIYAEIDALLFPALDKVIPKVKELPLEFGKFSLCYKGSRFEDMAPVTLSFHIDEFSCTDKKGNVELLQISSGQLPPQPYVIKGSGVTILTFRSNNDKRIYPEFFQVMEGLPG